LEIYLWFRLLVLCSVLVGGPSYAADVGTYQVGPRDVLGVEVYGEDEITRQFEVSANGTITVPFIGTLSVQGLTADEIQQELTARFLDGILNQPQVSVRVAEHRSQQVEVYGAVKKPGPFYLEGPTTLLEMIGRAGWIDSQKSSRHVIVRRATGEAVALSLTSVMAGSEDNLVLRPGDVISVEEGQLVYVGGEVEDAGSVVFFEGLTVMQALLKAGGPSETARLRGAYLVRDGEKIPVNLKRMSDGREPDVGMQPGDQLFVKESPI